MARAKLTYSAGRYTPAGLQGITNAQLKAEYNRMYDILSKRASGLKSAGYSYTESYRQTSRALRGGRISVRANKLTAKEVKTMQYNISTMARAFMSPTGTASGMRRQINRTIESLHQAGYTGVTSRNFRQFQAFMAKYRASYDEHSVGSATAAQFFSEEKGKGKRVGQAELSAAFDRYVQQQGFMSESAQQRAQEIISKARS